MFIIEYASELHVNSYLPIFDEMIDDGGGGNCSETIVYDQNTKQHFHLNFNIYIMSLLLLTMFIIEYASELHVNSYLPIFDEMIDGGGGGGGNCSETIVYDQNMKQHFHLDFNIYIMSLLLLTKFIIEYASELHVNSYLPIFDEMIDGCGGGGGGGVGKFSITRGIRLNRMKLRISRIQTALRNVVCRMLQEARQGKSVLVMLVIVVVMVIVVVVVVDSFARKSPDPVLLRLRKSGSRILRWCIGGWWVLCCWAERTNGGLYGAKASVMCHCRRTTVSEWLSRTCSRGMSGGFSGVKGGDGDGGDGGGGGTEKFKVGGDVGGGGGDSYRWSTRKRKYLVENPKLRKQQQQQQQQHLF
ncbi:hypothetical protein M0804_009598 [Polistes exclamans]|nr:hypothetical protein M0804_009598 [Polistes exclamans]